MDAHRADALVALAKAHVADDHDPDRANVLVHVDLEVLMAGTKNARIAGGPAIHPDVARKLTCDGRLQTVLHDADGAVVGIGRASRTVPVHIRRLVEHRDGYRCTFPGCGSKRFTEAHHVVPWELGGPTDLNNLTLICSYHHKLVHEGGWFVRLTPHGTTEWMWPDRSPYVPGRAPPEQAVQATQIFEHGPSPRPPSELEGAF